MPSSLLLWLDAVARDTRFSLRTLRREMAFTASAVLIAGLGIGVWTQRSIVVAEIALVCVLLTGAGLLMRSLVRVLDVDLGFDAENVIAVRVDQPRASSRESNYRYFGEVLRQVRAVPGVDSVGLTDALPLGANFGWRRWGASTPGRVDPPGERVSPLVRVVDDGYFAAMRVPLRAGRRFTADDDSASSEPVIIVNETLAATLWPHEDPVGRILRTWPGPPGGWRGRRREVLRTGT